MEERTTIPVIIIHDNPDVRLAETLDLFASTGAHPCAAICNSSLTEDYDDIRADLPITSVSSENLRYEIGRLLIDRKEYFRSYSQVMVYSDSKFVDPTDIIQCIYFTGWESGSFHLLETSDYINPKRTPGLILLNRLFGEQIETPEMIWWVIPHHALEVLWQEDKVSSYFPLSWLHDCHEEGIEIRNVSIEDSGTPRHTTSSAWSSLRMLMYSLKLFFRYIFSSFTGMLVDNLVFFALTRMGLGNLLPLIAARIASTLTNYGLLRMMVFQEKGTNAQSFIRYIGLVIFSGSMVFIAIRLGVKYTSIDSTIIKMAAEGVLFIFNYFMSKLFVFSNGRVKTDEG